ncbi:DUF3717 domain-containing protein [Bordetella genomosp. 9]|uniref:DUF3717 domain-containing protein n=1 Tax=Bordetella genomosp. 9 TaxID=1416803 RepID=A0A1W6YVJ4_9BORD|nr:DUF3717 domain-containing protein [Bordetella genomosp. 9]ARP84909.1 hypothetical protein CAL13_00715 [Bordetella genomosp. 9]ARP92409.1 hypothetical protein CAL14_00705 [Bordetella genomosp. 9]
MDTIPISRLEDAINYWRNRSPSTGDESRLCPEAAALAVPYAMMIFARQREFTLQDLDGPAGAAFESWRAAMGQPGNANG